MKPAPFDYVAPASVDEACALLAEAGGGATVLAGGQTPLTPVKLLSLIEGRDLSAPVAPAEFVAAAVAVPAAKVPQPAPDAAPTSSAPIIGAVGGCDIDTMPFAIVQAKRLRLQAVTVGSCRDQIDIM